MTLNLALGSATSSLRAVQSQLALASNNIANADTEGYTTKSARKVSTVTGESGIGTGTEVDGIVSKVDARLQKSIVRATSENAATATTTDYLDQLGDVLGTLSSDETGGSTLASSLSSLQSTLTELAATPESDTLKNQAVLQLADTAADLRDSSAQVQDLRARADADIADAVDALNNDLLAIDDLNQTIVSARVRGQSTVDMEDQRMTLVNDMAEQLDISYYVDGDGAMSIYTGGQQLLNSQVHTLSYQAAGMVTSETQYPTGFDPIELNDVDITASLKSGTLAALVELRDSTLPAVQDQLDAIAVDLKDSLNALNNQGSAWPAPSTLTGTVEGLSGASLSATGTLRVAVTDEDGVVVSTSDIDLSGIGSIDELVSALDGVDGMSAAYDDDTGVVVLTADDEDTGIALSGGDVDTDDDGEGDAVSISSLLGLNDLLTGDGAEDLYVRTDIADDPTLLSVATVSDADELEVGDAGLTLNSGALAQSMADAIDDSGASTAATALVSDLATQLEAAQSAASAKETTLNTLTDTFSSKYGVNIDEESALITQLESTYSASARIVSTVKEMFESLLDAVS